MVDSSGIGLRPFMRQVPAHKCRQPGIDRRSRATVIEGQSLGAKRRLSTRWASAITPSLWQAPDVGRRMLGEMLRAALRDSAMTSWLLLLVFFQPFTFQLAYGIQSATIVVRGSFVVAETDDNFVCATLDWWPPEKCNYNQCPWGRASVLNLDLHHPILAKAIQAADAGGRVAVVGGLQVSWVALWNGCEPALQQRVCWSRVQQWGLVLSWQLVLYITAKPFYVLVAFNPLRIRIGGSLQDQVVYEEPNMICHPFQKMSGGLFGFSKGCLSMARWDELNALFQKTGAVITFGLNALRGRHSIHYGAWGGPWNASNARSFMEYTVSKGYRVDSWEFGNELSGHGVGARVDAQLYGKDLIQLKTIVDELYKKSPRPLVLAPGGFYEQQWYSQLLQVSGSGVVNVMTHHIYNLGAGDDPRLINRILDPQHLSQIANTFRDLQLVLRRHGPWSSAWVSESGGAYNSGGRLVSDTFIDSFWYLDQLGLAAKYNTKVYCRQTLIGGNYGLLDTRNFIPNPDYYSALLWHRVMGKGVLGIDISGSPFLRAYAHCAKHRAGVSLLLINLSNSTAFNVSVQNDMNMLLAEGDAILKEGGFIHGLKRAVSWVGRKASEGALQREEYHLTAKDGYHRSQTMLLNGNPLQLTKEGDIPAMDPVLVPLHSPIHLIPLSIAFVVFPNFEARACV
ncbi:hypothetical protein Taro_025041 [Colocasia esculenta]|uniref:Heparanase-like protein 1 n=1 Tax=Colocasia esculenta TaxID=4460 RepID=A0A843VFE5_COLES|nr:hypothetical protein [Colocasia esculenta]